MLPQRKNVRLQHFDYHANGYYFITICCLDKRPLLGTLHQGEIQVSLDGQHLLEEMFSLERTLRGISVYDYVIMPNHFHLVVEIQRKEGETGMGVSGFVRLLKGNVTKRSGKSLWQRGYYEHVVRQDESLQEIVQYMKNNPRRWELRHSGDKDILW
ncbi:transposase [Acidaminococcus timonensis]|uniref:transposase n=1 Tax=Acidaminococcus timonensis TaxID=1871002 RepID=UPI0026F057D1|nr:transposase [Acidaminococcus timonensis]